MPIQELILFHHFKKKKINGRRVLVEYLWVVYLWHFCRAHRSEDQVSQQLVKGKKISDKSLSSPCYPQPPPTPTLTTRICLFDEKVGLFPLWVKLSGFCPEESNGPSSPGFLFCFRRPPLSPHVLSPQPHLEILGNCRPAFDSIDGHDFSRMTQFSAD